MNRFDGLLTTTVAPLFGSTTRSASLRTVPCRVKPSLRKISSARTALGQAAAFAATAKDSRGRGREGTRVKLCDMGNGLSLRGAPGEPLAPGPGVTSSPNGPVNLSIVTGRNNPSSKRLQPAARGG